MKLRGDHQATPLFDIELTPAGEPQLTCRFFQCRRYKNTLVGLYCQNFLKRLENQGARPPVPTCSTPCTACGSTSSCSGWSAGESVT